jgi:aminobenzoyl-glutamate transport protein
LVIAGLALGRWQPSQTEDGVTVVPWMDNIILLLSIFFVIVRPVLWLRLGQVPALADVVKAMVGR